MEVENPHLIFQSSSDNNLQKLFQMIQQYELATKNQNFLKDGIQLQKYIPTSNKNLKKIPQQQIKRYSQLFQQLYKQVQKIRQHPGIKSQLQFLKIKLKYETNKEKQINNYLDMIQKVRQNNQKFIFPRYYQYQHSKCEDGIQFIIERGLTFPYVDIAASQTDSENGFNLFYSYFSKSLKDKFTKDIVQNVQQLHKLKIQHGDIEIRNIIYSIIDNRFKLIDFGKSVYRTYENYTFEEDKKSLILMILKLNYNLIGKNKYFDLGKRIKEICSIIQDQNFRQWPSIKKQFGLFSTKEQQEKLIINSLQDLIKYLDNHNNTLSSQQRYSQKYFNSSSDRDMRRAFQQNQRQRQQQSIDENQKQDNKDSNITSTTQSKIKDENKRSQISVIENQNNQLNQNSQILPHQQKQQNIVESNIKPCLSVLVVAIVSIIVIFVTSFLFYQLYLKSHKLTANLIQKYVQQLPKIEVVQLQNQQSSFIYQTQKYINFLPKSLNILTKTFAFLIIAKPPNSSYFSEFYNPKIIIQKDSKYTLVRTSNLSNGNSIFIQPSILHSFSSGLSETQKNNQNNTILPQVYDENASTFYQVSSSDQFQQKIQSNLDQGIYYHSIKYKNNLFQKNYSFSQIFQVKTNFTPAYKSEIELQINDISLYDNGSLILDDFMGNIILVNKKSWPFKIVEQQQYILKVINTCKLRNLTLYFEDQFKQIISFQILTQNNYSEITQSVFLAPFSMIYIKFNFFKTLNSVYLRNRIQDWSFNSSISIQRNLQSQSTRFNAFQNSDSQIMKFIINSDKINPSSQIKNQTIKYIMIVIGIIVYSLLAIIVVFIICAFIAGLYIKLKKKLKKDQFLEQQLDRPQNLQQTNKKQKKYIYQSKINIFEQKDI